MQTFCKCEHVFKIYICTRLSDFSPLHPGNKRTIRDNSTMNGLVKENLSCSEWLGHVSPWNTI